jgi:hypothetical protein
MIHDNIYNPVDEEMDQCPHKFSYEGPCTTIHLPGIPEGFSPEMPMPNECKLTTTWIENFTKEQKYINMKRRKQDVHTGLYN